MFLFLKGIFSILFVKVHSLIHLLKDDKLQLLLFYILF